MNYVLFDHGKKGFVLEGPSFRCRKHCSSQAAGIHHQQPHLFIKNLLRSVPFLNRSGVEQAGASPVEEITFPGSGA